jgi:hypothetical protein
MQKVPGVVSVRVSLNEGLTVLELTPGNTITLANLRQVIRNNGFTTREAQVVARGSVSLLSNGVSFEVGGSHERLMLRRDAKQPQAFDNLRTRLKTEPSFELVISGAAELSDPKLLVVTVISAQRP